MVRNTNKLSNTTNGFQLSRKTSVVIICIILMLMIGLQMLWHLWPRTRHEIEQCQARIEHRHTEMVVKDNKLLFISTDSTTVYDAVWVNRYRMVPSCRGRLMANVGNERNTSEKKELSAKEIIESKIAELTETTKSLKKDIAEAEYYLRSHGVQDEGYDIAAENTTLIRDKYEKAKRLLDTLTNVKNLDNAVIKKQDSYNVTYRNINGLVEKESCRPLKFFSEQRQMFETTDKTKPLGIRPRYYKLSEIIHPTASFTDSLNRDVVRLTRAGVGNVFLPNKIYGISVDKKGRKTVGRYQNDTLYAGMRYDSLGYYYGQLSKGGIAEGHGRYYSANGDFYEGRWHNDKRDGFGYQLRKGVSARSGEWVEDIFKGERLNYTSDRIYGIDIARYQHEIGRHVYPILWNELRITDLGKISKKRISGNVDYPVSFIYIKSTEGTTVMNKYYSADYKAAKSHGKLTGTYHFFSTKSAGTAQAAYFLKNSRIEKGDMPPVLDVEPSHSQIMAMGGVETMFRHIRDWMTVVERKTGCRPVLYVSQSFVNNYLEQAPDIKKKYNVWIARYGEYKPDVHLVYWQLSPDGKVKGIHGDVDINVFNGYQTTFADFLSQSRVP